MQKLPSGKYSAVVRHGGVKRNGKAQNTRREALADEARIRLEMGSAPEESQTTVDALLKDQIEQGAYAVTTLEDGVTFTASCLRRSSGATCAT